MVESPSHTFQPWGSWNWEVSFFYLGFISLKILFHQEDFDFLQRSKRRSWNWETLNKIGKYNNIFGRNVKCICTRQPKDCKIYLYKDPNSKNNSDTQSDLVENKKKKKIESKKIDAINKNSTRDIEKQERINK